MRKLKCLLSALGIVFLFSCTHKNEEKSIENYNYILGTQTVGAKYKFTEETNLVETAKAIQAMGSNILKFSLSPRYWWENYDIPKNERINSLTDLAKENSVKTVLDMDFKYYQIWAYEFSQYLQEDPGKKQDVNQIQFVDGLSDENAQKSYQEVYDLACYLLREYSGSGKVFYLGNWEGDWHLRWDYDRNKEANPATIQGMTRWINVRQQAIDDAKKHTPHTNIELYHYLEVNLSDLAVAGKPCVVNSILPNTNVDYISFSSYTATNPPRNESEMDSMLTSHLNYIESKIPAKESIKGKRLFIGEYGWGDIPDEETAQRAKWVIKTALKWGTPFILFWEMYNNEITQDGKLKGFWLIDKDNQKTPLYYTHQNFYQESKSFVTDFRQKENRLPTQEEFCNAAMNFNALR